MIYPEQIVTFLISQGAKVIVDACNTTSALALPYLKTKFDVPIIGVLEPGASSAVEAANKKIGVIATSATIKSNCYQESIVKKESNMQELAISLSEISWLHRRW